MAQNKCPASDCRAADPKQREATLGEINELSSDMRVKAEKSIA